MERTQKIRKEVPPTYTEWVTLRKLIPDSEGTYTLHLQLSNQKSRNDVGTRTMVTLFSPYNLIHKSIKFLSINTKDVISLSFPSYFTAYRAWREKNKNVCFGATISIEPACGDANSVTNGTYIFVSDLPKGLLMSTLVTSFAKYNGLICINPIPRECSVIIGYSTLKSARKASTEAKTIKVDGQEYPIIIQLLAERPLVQFGSVKTHQLKFVKNESTNEIAETDCSSKTSENDSSNRRGMSGRNRRNRRKNNSSTPVYRDSVNGKDVIEQDDSASVTKNCSNNSIDRKTSGNDGSEPINNCSNYDNRNTTCKGDTISRDDYGFCLDYESYLQMYQTTCRKQPNILENVSNDIRILVTHKLEAQKFWGWILSESKVSVKKLNKIEKQIAVAARKSPPPYVLPKSGNCGVALYKDTWYRCFILQSNDETGKLKVFYCDYGNTELISLEKFRFTSNDVWNLPPQAIPFLMHNEDNAELENPPTSVVNPLDGQCLHATVIKTKQPQPHIVEVMNISCVCAGDDGATSCSWCHKPLDDINGCDDTISISSTETYVVSRHTSRKSANHDVRKAAVNRNSKDTSVNCNSREHSVKGNSRENSVKSNSRENSVRGNSRENSVRGNSRENSVKANSRENSINRKSRETSSVNHYSRENSLNHDVKENSLDQHTSENVDQKEIFGMTSLFKYENEDLVLGIFSEVHHPNLIYLKLGDESQFSSLRSAIDKAELILPNDLCKGKLFLLHDNNKRSRVCILQMFSGFAQVKVLHVDTGVIEWVTLNRLYHLDRDLRETRYQAKPAILAGIDCQGKKIEETILYLKNKVNSVVIANIMHENNSGKIYVELFDLETKRSINKELVDNGIADPTVDNILYTDEDITPYMIPLDSLESTGSQSRLIPLIERLFKS